MTAAQMDETGEPLPRVGHAVHYFSYGTPGGEFTGECRAALVAGKSGPLVLDLAVLNPSGLFFNAVDRGMPGEGGTWHPIGDECSA